MNRLEKLAKEAKSIEQFVAKLKAFPKWYLVTEEQKRMGLQQLREFYLSRNKGGR